MLYYPQMKPEREKWMRSGALLLTLVIVLLSLVLWLLMGGHGRLEAGFSLPRSTPTAEVSLTTPTPAQLKITPPPTPILVQVIRNYPPEAVDLVADGKVLFTVETESAAREILDRYLSESAAWGLQPNERLIKAGFDQQLTLEEPSGQGELLSVDEAVNTLKADDSLLPVVRTVVRCVVEPGELDTEVRENAALPKGSRIYREWGVYPYILSYYETVYRGQAAFSEVKTNEFAVGPGRVEDHRGRRSDHGEIVPVGRSCRRGHGGRCVPVAGGWGCDRFLRRGGGDHALRRGDRRRKRFVDQSPGGGRGGLLRQAWRYGPGHRHPS